MRITSVIAIVLIAITTTSRAQAPAGGAPRPPAGPQMRGDGPAPTPKPFNITKSDSGLDTIVASDAKLELIAGGCGINEGVMWVRDSERGYVLVSSLIDNVMYKI